MSLPPASCSVRTVSRTAKVKKIDPPRTRSRQKRCGLTRRTDHPDTRAFDLDDLDRPVIQEPHAICDIR
jgi:hypothetical protein